MKNDSKLLFITEKWTDANPNSGLTNHYHNIFGSFKNSYPNVHFNILHFDEWMLAKKRHVDSDMLKISNLLKPEYVFVSLLGNSNLNPSSDSWKILKDQGSKLIFIWPDVSHRWGIKQISEDLKLYADLHVCWGSEINIKLDNILWLWAPQDENLYYPDEQDINVSFVGSINNVERQKYLSFLLKNKINLSIRGGQRQENLTPQAYASIIRKSKISLNFPGNDNGFDQCKGRVWEILASKSLLLERKNKATESRLLPNIDYVEYTDENDLKEKIEYYLNNENDRKKIQQNGYNTYIKKYNAKLYWEKIFLHLQGKGIL